MASPPDDFQSLPLGDAPAVPAGSAGLPQVGIKNARFLIFGQGEQGKIEVFTPAPQFLKRLKAHCAGGAKQSDGRSGHTSLSSQRLDHLLDTIAAFEMDVTPVISAGIFRRANRRARGKKF